MTHITRKLILVSPVTNAIMERLALSVLVMCLTIFAVREVSCYGKGSRLDPWGGGNRHRPSAGYSIVGENNAPQGSPIGCSTSNGKCIFVFNRPRLVSGKLSTWFFWPTNSAPFTGLVMRPYGRSNSGQFKVIGINEIPASATLNEGVSEKILPNNQITVEDNDLFGVAYDASNNPGFFSEREIDKSAWTTAYRLEPDTELNVNDILTIQATLFGRLALLVGVETD